MLKKLGFCFLFMLPFLPVISNTKSGFTMWQLPSQVNTIGNSYIFLTDKGRVVVMDGGMKDETSFLRGFLAALGNEVEAWIISHPHNDHVGALTEILKEPKGLKIHTVYHSRFSDELVRCEQPYDQYAFEFYEALDASGIQVLNQTEPGLAVKIDGLNFKILGVTNEEIRNNPYNNSSMIVRVWDKKKSIVFLADAGIECGDKVLNSPYRKDLDCDYLQVSHHGQRGCSEQFYKTIRFKACLWSTPLWVWNNDQGKGTNTGSLETFDTRRWMDEIGIKKHHVSCLEGLYKLE
ncbi:MAG: MBL fold metallo-hydrolase [Prevotella sp.]|jgi:beta-lactamase superfamily II metal-dependent hydrolase|nr:MBL fold metallo-hydrolase [Prevotella sp.]